ncbi:MAG: hypothetical protein H7Z40_20655 [Phycisphaerae bacterium]|nr:hypothetical protein [Gemmatimonadaceae bacterium]
MKHIRTLGFVVATATVSQAAAAQIPAANAAGFSMAGNYTAVARGYDAIAFNPANLALGQPKQFGLSLFAVNVSNGINPISLSDLKAHENVLIPAATRESWLQEIGSGRQTGAMAGGVSLVALNVRSFGLQVGVVGAGEVNLNQDAAEALLFGNAGRTGSAKDFNFSGSNANGSLFGVGAVSYGFPVRSNGRGDQLTFGVTAKYVRGFAAARAADNGSVTTADQISVEFPVIYTDSNHIGNAGSGFGVDLGLSWAKSGTTYSVTARNVVNTFAWSPDAFTSRAGGFRFDGVNNNSNFDEAPYSSAPAAMRSAFEAEKFRPELAAGVAHHFGKLLLTADGSQRFGDGIDLSPKMRAGIGAEYTGLSVLALRGGVAAITDGFQGAAGVGLRVGTFELSVGAMTRSTNGQGQTGFMLNVMSLR